MPGGTWVEVVFCWRELPFLWGGYQRQEDGLIISRYHSTAAYDLSHSIGSPEAATAIAGESEIEVVT